MNIDKELEEIFNDPLLSNISDKEKDLFDIPDDMRNVMDKRPKRPDYVAQHKLCEDFAAYKHLFKQVHQELKEGKRSLVKLTKTENIEARQFFIVSGQLVYLEQLGDAQWTENVRGRNARTRCIYENGTEADILLQTLRKNVMEDGYAVTETNNETNSRFFTNSGLEEEDEVTGYIYVLRSLSTNPIIQAQKNLYKIGFSTTTVEERIANAANEPTYLMASVEIVASYKTANIHAQRFEDMIHQILKSVQYHITVTDDAGEVHAPKEWFVVPLSVINSIIEKIVEGSIIDYVYNPQLQCLEKIVRRQVSTFDTSGMKVLTLNIKKVYFDEILSGEKTIEYRELKPSTQNKYVYLDESDGKHYLRRYDALRLFVGYHKDRDSALVEVKDITFDKDSRYVEYHLGNVLEVVSRDGRVKGRDV